ncbi:MAG: hypothetical protein GX176_00035 [Syntrophomonadaceae bacterium]|nr:hypothetical protein [Syntrophomonadaceae bacterium]
MIILTNKDDLIEAYRNAEIIRMKLLSMLIYTPDNNQTAAREILEDMVRTEVHRDYVKITIKDVLPREADIPKIALKEHWHSLMAHALKDVNWQADKVLCVIKVISTANYWDTDNRAYKFIIDSLRYNQIVPNDTHNNLSYLVIGGEIDKENPRTEIYLVKHPEDPLFFVQNR